MSNSSIYLLLSFLLGYINADITFYSATEKRYQASSDFAFLCTSKSAKNKLCKNLSAICSNCSYNSSCTYGGLTKGTCTIITGAHCEGDRSFEVTAPCYHCYQLPTTNYTCNPRAFCQATASVQERLIVNCTVNPDQHCLGQRTFNKSFACNWTSGKRWSTSLILSITLGGFGVDQFYLGDWKKGLGKLFTFGGLGVWTLVDIVLVSVGYITPADGSLYIF